jgi:two-component system sensor histidine kinase KdpD
MHISLARSIVVLLENNGDLYLVAAWPPEDSLDAAAMTAAWWAYQHNEPAGANTGTLPTIPWYFIPLRFSERMLGVIGVAREKDQRDLDSEALALLDTLAEQTASALDRARLSREMVSAKTATEAERVRNTMLASISHDFRTPLSSILGSASSLLDYSDKLAPAARNDLLQHIKAEAEGLDELVRNLLAVTRIEAGALELRRDWVDLREIVQRIVNAARRRGAAQHFETKLPLDFPLIRADAALIEQAIGTIVANAVMHTPRQTTISIEGAVKEGETELAITDDGPGIPVEALPRIFEKFVSLGSASGADGGHGTGLGLAIAKGIAEAHGGFVEAQSPAAGGRGTRFILHLPREEA